MTDRPVSGFAVRDAAEGEKAHIAISGSTDEHNQEFARNAIEHMFQLWFTPELQRRATLGSLKPGFQLIIAQALISDDKPVEVRFNDEARLEALIKAPRALEKGEPIRLNDLSGVQAVELPKSELDCGHVTIIQSALGTRLFFNFRRGRDRAAAFTDQADQFLETAVGAIASGRPKVALENLHTAAEMVSLSHLIVNSRNEAHGGTHKVIRSGINLWSKTGNIDVAFVKLFNNIAQLRDKTRYNPRAASPEIPTDACDLIRAEISYLRQHWRWRDGNVELLLKARPDLVLFQLDEKTTGVMLASV